MRFIYIKIYVFALYIFYILPKAFLNFFFKRDTLKLKLGKYDSLFSDYEDNFDKDFNSKNSKITSGNNSEETPDDKYPLW
jgi:hypothetical protein|tara:strand:- start:274 stop:513 length:240 start_codon:yes stop_codon:yes gene_type:complete